MNKPLFEIFKNEMYNKEITLEDVRKICTDLGIYIKFETISEFFKYMMSSVAETTDNANPSNVLLLDESVSGYKSTDDLLITKYRSLISNNKLINVQYEKLTPDQRIIFERIHQAITNSYYIDDSYVKTPKCMLLDANPGTGKTTLVCNLSSTLKRPILVIVYRKSLACSLNKLVNINGLTICSFILRVLNISYYTSINLFTSKYLIKNLYDIIRYCNKAKEYRTELLVLDEYTIPSPFVILFIYAYCRKYKINVMYCGDKFQLSSINKSSYHRQTNYSLCKQLITEDEFTLVSQVRIIDESYKEKVLQFKNKYLIETKNIPLRFSHLYMIYELLSKKFIADADINNIFLAQYHRTIALRQQQYIQYAEKNKIKYIKSNYMYKADSNHLEFQGIDKSQFLEYIPIVETLLYVYYQKSGEVRYVKIKRITNDCLFVVDLENQMEYPISKVPIDTYILPQTVREFLLKYTSSLTSLLQYPLWPYALTYHSIQGMTIIDSKIELDLDAETANSLYVALTRVKSEKQLARLHTKKLFHLIMTSYKNDDYYYNFSNASNEQKQQLLVYAANKTRSSKLDKEQFDIVNSIALFNKTYNVKILKHLYTNESNQQLALSNDTADSKLAVIADFIKNNFGEFITYNHVMLFNKVKSLLRDNNIPWHTETEELDNINKCIQEDSAKNQTKTVARPESISDLVIPKKRPKLEEE